MPALGQFTLRDEGKTIANGRVLRYKPAQIMSASQRAEQLAKKNAAVSEVAAASKAGDITYNPETG